GLITVTGNAAARSASSLAFSAGPNKSQTGSLDGITASSEVVFGLGTKTFMSASTTAPTQVANTLMVVNDALLVCQSMVVASLPTPVSGLAGARATVSNSNFVMTGNFGTIIAS